MDGDNLSSIPLLSHHDDSQLDGSNKNTAVLTDNGRSFVFSKVVDEIKSLYIIALPTIITGLLIYGKSAISMHFLGKISKDALAGGSLAIGIANITGFSVISGLAAGMDGISSQAYGAQQLVLVGQILQCTIIILIIICIPISILWVNSESILALCGQNSTISFIASTYLIFTLPDLFFQCLINPLKIYLRTQNVTSPLMFSSALALILHFLMNYLILHTFSLDIRGIALISAITDLNFLIILLVYLWFTGACSKSWNGWSWECFNQWKPILHQSIPSCVSICLEWWWYELLIIFSGLLTNTADALATTGIIIQATSLIYNFPFALSLAISTRVGNELGAQRPNKAKASSFIALLCSIFTGIMAMIFMITMSNVWGRMYTKDKAILSLLATTLPIVGLCEIGNCPQTTICGVLKGSARPTLGANINLVSFYGVGFPISVLMGFVFNLGLLGLLLGLLAAQIVCATIMIIVLARTDWRMQADRAKELIGGINVSNGENHEGMEALVSRLLN
ncbi:hypothetical protein RJT34_08914 [Clitoria ternatea]|uniref:Protein DETOXIFICATION n=1 Tax=Clitoria ternatea TaxID=43366 RepID=A0AAN9PUW4_CLITE